MVDIDELERLLEAADELAANMAETVKEWEGDEPPYDWFLHQHDHANAVEMLNAQSTEIRQLRAENARLREANGILEDGLQEVGDDYPGSSCQEWCLHQIAQARAALGEPQ